MNAVWRGNIQCHSLPLDLEASVIVTIELRRHDTVRRVITLALIGPVFCVLGRVIGAVRNSPLVAADLQEVSFFHLDAVHDGEFLKE